MTVRNLVSVELKHSVHLQLSMQGQRTDSDDEVMSDEILGLWQRDSHKGPDLGRFVWWFGDVTILGAWMRLDPVKADSYEPIYYKRIALLFGGRSSIHCSFYSYSCSIIHHLGAGLPSPSNFFLRHSHHLSQWVEEDTMPLPVTQALRVCAQIRSRPALRLSHTRRTRVCRDALGVGCDLSGSSRPVPEAASSTACSRAFLQEASCD